MPVRPRIVLITGAGGYIGLPTVSALLAAGHQVHALGRHDPGIAGVPFHQADVLAADNLAACLKAIAADTLIHGAWSVTPGQFWTDPANDDWAEASLRLFKAFAAAGGRRIVGIGSCAEYDWTQSPLMEHVSSKKPATLYGTAKAATWQGLAALAQAEGLSAAWARVFFLYGPREPRGKLVADAVCALLAGGTVATTPGLQRRDFIHVGDAGRAIALLAASDVQGAVNIASGNCVPVRDVLAEVERATGTSGHIDYGARALAAGEPLELAADITRLRDEVGFTAQHSLASGIADTVRWWREAASQPR